MKNLRLINASLAAILMMMTTPCKTQSAASSGEMVILLHGMGRRASSMRKIERCLKNSGYKTLNINYLSTRKSIIEIAEEDVVKAVKMCNAKGATKIHFVTHSLGGIVLRQYLQSETLPKGSRAVMLSPPNKGSEVAEFMKDFSLYKWVMGPAGQTLGIGQDSIPNMLNPIDLEIGIIIGDKSLNPAFSKLIEGPNDGKVSVARSKLDEMTDFFIVPATHTFIMRHPVVLAQVSFFLKSGRFQKR